MSVGHVTTFAPRHVKPVLFQCWKSLSFLHWRYEPETIQRLLPPGLTVDMFDGSAWVGIASFLLSDLRVRFTPALPRISSFPETNLRTYVMNSEGEPGIWFLSLDAARLAAVFGARRFYGLPYHWADMRVEGARESIRYQSKRRRVQDNASADICVEIGEPLVAEELDVFLTARFRFYSILHGKLSWADIEHEPWPLYNARGERVEQTLIEASGLPPANGEPLAHYSPGVQVKIGAVSH